MLPPIPERMPNATLKVNMLSRSELALLSILVLISLSALSFLEQQIHIVDSQRRELLIWALEI